MISIVLLLLLLFGFVFFCIATWGVSSRWNLIGAGLACWILVEIIERAMKIS